VKRDIVIRLFREGKKEIRVDSRLIKDRMDLVENIPCIVFSHQDLAFVNGPPEMGRRFFNQTLSLFDPLFITLLRSYRKLLKSRNVLLKSKNTSLLDAYTRNLAKIGLRIQSRRQNIIEEFNETFSELFRKISGFDEKTSIRYKSSWHKGATDEQVTELMKKRQDRDLMLETTTTGPHRDRFQVMHGKREIAQVASTGQIRLCSLILRVSQANFFSAKTGKNPLLLLDDVLLELDSKKRDKFMEALPHYEQAFFTFLPDEQFLKYKRADTLMYRVVRGEFRREKSS